MLITPNFESIFLTRLTAAWLTLYRAGDVTVPIFAAFVFFGHLREVAGMRRIDSETSGVAPLKSVSIVVINRSSNTYRSRNIKLATLYISDSQKRAFHDIYIWLFIYDRDLSRSTTPTIVISPFIREYHVPRTYNFQIGFLRLCIIWDSNCRENVLLICIYIYAVYKVSTSARESAIKSGVGVASLRQATRTVKLTARDNSLLFEIHYGSFPARNRNNAV